MQQVRDRNKNKVSAELQISHRNSYFCMQERKFHQKLRRNLINNTENLIELNQEKKELEPVIESDHTDKRR